MWNVMSVLGSGSMAILIAAGVILLIAGLVKKIIKLVIIGLILAVAAMLLTGGIQIAGIFG